MAIIFASHEEPEKRYAVHQGQVGGKWNETPSLVPGHTCALLTLTEPFPCAPHYSTDSPISTPSHPGLHWSKTP